MFNNIILNTDSYKSSHYLQYPQNSEYVSSYIEARGGEFPEHVFFGLQAFIKAYLLRPITQQDIDEAEAIITAHGEPFNRAGWQYILDKYEGKLPVEIEALPEGKVVPTGTALVQLVNTDSHLVWLTSYLETALLRAIWYPTTVATISWRIKQAIRQALILSSEQVEEQLPFKLHDFGARGVSSMESAAIGGLAHLVNFKGTDTLSAILAARRYYAEEMAGFSIPAAEHSTITSWGQAHEVDAYRNMLQQFAKPNSLVAVVSDSYDIYHAVTEIWGKQLKQDVIDSGATLIIRPDSGDPKTVVLEVLERLWDAFGGKINVKGYRVLADCVRVIQGDGVNEQSIRAILDGVLAAGFSADNIAFGMGGALLQQANRDTLSFAMKASAISTKGRWTDVFKDPVTDKGKRSKKGRLAVVETDQGIKTIRYDTLKKQTNLLQPVYRNGVLLHEYTLQQVRELSDA
jgi:nicotinamide phosphoribosyltransferase